MRVQSRHLVLFVLRRGLKVSVGQNHGTELQISLVERPIQTQKVQHVIAESANTSLLDRDDNAIVFRKFSDQIDIKGLHEPRVSHRHGKIRIHFLNLVSGDEGLGKTCAKGKDGNAILFLLTPGSRAQLGVGTAIRGRFLRKGAHSSGEADDAPLSNFDGCALGGNLPILQFIPEQLLQLLWAISHTPWIPQHCWSIIKVGTCHDHIPQLHLIARAHDRQVRDASQISQIVTSMVRRSIISNNSRPV
mmetsp:Transcript_20339/g.36535  ORF Transcript_20339/g.36535 Transcript_20339/m.36535 type:complete len:247 (+) Transcript_20339:241-981(+)